LVTHSTQTTAKWDLLKAWGGRDPGTSITSVCFWVFFFGFSGWLGRLQVEHELHELRVVDQPVLVGISLLDELLQLLLGELLAKV